MQKKENIREMETEVEQSDLDSEITSEITFLQEKIKERPVNRRKLVRRTVITVVMAMVFGVVACVTFLLLEPVINRMIYPEKETEIVRFPEEEEEVSPEDMAADEEELQIIREEEAAGNKEDGSEDPDGQEITATEGETTTEAPGDKEGTGSGENTAGEISPEEAAKITTLEEYQALYGVLGELRAEVEKSIVSVTAVTSDVNWINDTLENTGVTSGLVVADNGRELLILTGYQELKGADSITVAFGGEQKEASVKETDQATGLAVIAVPLQELSGEQLEGIAYAVLGSSAGRILVGQPIMALGSPVGISDSVCYGMVTSQGAALGLLDSNYKLLTTDIYGSRSASGVLANMRGEVVGILYNGQESDDMQNGLCAIGISELKRTIEKLSNGEKMVYLGIHGAEINSVIYQEYQLPKGAYVTGIDMDSPAMQAGLQSGDIITKVGEEDIVSYAEFVNMLMKAQVGQNLKLTVARQNQGKGEYQEMTVTVTLKEQTVE
ncbi:MAG: PDZ domain-containing protein [Lachnospiraceae bacterium]|jgi:serine protease Do|nr:PDZ domain-containing protein [Lachnospiraceae bacterium]